MFGGDCFCTVEHMRIPRPRPWDVLFALAGAAALVAEGIHRGTGPVAVAIPLALLACLPLAWSSQAPLTALLGVAAGLLICVPVFQPYDTAVFVLAVALFNVARLGDRRRSLIVGAGTAVFLVAVIMIVASDHIARNTGLRLGVALGALVLGDAVRSRRELREARREQDLRISHEREQESRRRVADERLRIARDLHDAVAHALVAINVRAGVAAHLHPSEDSDGALTDIRTVSAEALNDLRATLSLLREADDAIRQNLQAHVAAIVSRYGELGHAPRPVFDLLLRYAVSEDGALHAEKYYRTVTEEFTAARPAFRWRQLIALARVSASEYGRPAPGIAEARRVLQLTPTAS